jgi:hypothetical protein
MNNDDLINDMLADVSNPEQAPDTLKRITSLANLLVEQERLVEQAEAALNEAKEAARRTREEDLPTLMKEVGLLTVKLEDGATVEVVEEVTCYITEEWKPEAHAWLHAHGFGGLIKTNVSVAFGKDESEAARALMLELAERHLSPEMKEAVHPSTLKSFVKETLAKAAEPDAVKLPMEAFGVRPFTKAKVKPPKAKPAPRARKSSNLI